jgi:hypothetical protein
VGRPLSRCVEVAATLRVPSAVARSGESWWRANEHPRRTRLGSGRRWSLLGLEPANVFVAIGQSRAESVAGPRTGVAGLLLTGSDGRSDRTIPARQILRSGALPCSFPEEVIIAEPNPHLGRIVLVNRGTPPRPIDD